MKPLPLVILSVGCLALNSCESFKETMNQPIQTVENDPLRSPSIKKSSSSSSNAQMQPSGPTFQPGQYVQASMPNTTFFRKKPRRGSATADKILSAGSSMKVISNSSAYVKVEIETGEVGYVPAIMLSEKSTTRSRSTSPGSSRSTRPTTNSGSSNVDAPIPQSASVTDDGNLAPEPEIAPIKPPSSVADEILPLPPNPTASDNTLIDPNMDLEIKISRIQR